MKVIRFLCRVATVVCMILIAALMLLMVAEVLDRAIFNRSIVGSTEWAQVMLVCTMSAFGASILANRQIRVNILTQKLKTKTKVILDIVVLVFTCATIAVLSWQQFLYTLKSFNSNVFYSNIGLPQWPFVALFASSYGVAALTIILLIIRKIMSASRGEWEKEAKLEDMDEIFVFGKIRGNIPKNSAEGEGRQGGGRHES